ncbi:MAG TPA: prepilin peptidase [Pyrinomonadaceae bacterium]|nr:prepilin peptidase [Pyrinomonadaceae bacterium]
MLAPQTLAIALLLVPMAIVITYMDVRYRRIPNKLVLVTLLGGLFLNTFFDGPHGLAMSLGGFGLAFAVMIFFHIFGTLGAGDVKLFAAIGAVNGLSLVLPTLIVVAITGGLLAICQMVYSRRVKATMFGVAQFFYGLLPGQTVPRFDIPTDRSYTLPYALPICFGSLIAFFLFHV